MTLRYLNLELELCDPAMDPRSPTPAEMMTLLHWWLMALSGAVLACDGLAEVEWHAIPSDEWNERYAR